MLLFLYFQSSIWRPGTQTFGTGTQSCSSGSRGIQAGFSHRGRSGVMARFRFLRAIVRHRRTPVMSLNLTLNHLQIQIFAIAPDAKCRSVRANFNTGSSSSLIQVCCLVMRGPTRFRISSNISGCMRIKLQKGQGPLAAIIPWVDHKYRTAFVSPVSAMTLINIVFADPRGAFFSCG